MALDSIHGIRGIRRRKKKPSTRSAASDNWPFDVVKRDFCVDAPNRLQVADITYIPARVGWVYASFVLDAYTPGPDPWPSHR
ncbi:hypothetical protein [Corynebacterium timonense]|uniref:Transposase n=1 Tax=Corynebacterium timonense TaxID=441500 RepID=A0A1H1LH26_9CORY|nr:hypothetical protein [Corynebacterium timonense]SDR73189.1 hypothetical protein SAMN04488539_0191 [Corynebacterium timonense]